MNLVWDFGEISDQINRGVAGDRVLSSATLVLCLSALSQMDNRSSWESLTDEEFDMLETWVSGAYQELLTPKVDNLEVWKAVVSYEEANGVDGDAITLDTLTTIPLNEEYDPYDLLDLSVDSEILLIAGRYHVDGWVAFDGVNRAKTWIQKTTGKKEVQGKNKIAEDAEAHIRGIFIADGTTEYIWTLLGNTSGQFGTDYPVDSDNEIYAQLTFTYLGEV